MWTNVFKIGGLRIISWFQFIPYESEVNAPPDKNLKIDQKDVAMFLVLSSHLQLQKEGFLTTWTNSFVGPWDPSQGLHNPDEKLKLWLFLPGRHSSVLESAQAAVSKLRVAASGLWLAPGDSEEIASALSQALRNRIERSLLGHSYLRFGDIFSKYNPPQSEELFRKGHPTVEFVFAASEEAIFVHVIISAKHIRAISSSDIEKVSKHSVNFGHELPVIVSPHGMRGKLTGYCPSDLVKQLYFSSSKSKNSNGFIGLPHHVSQGSGYQLRGWNCFVEVTLGFHKSVSEKAFQSNTNLVKSLPNNINAEPSFVKVDQKGLHDTTLYHEKQIVYPSEAVLVPVIQNSFARSSLKRFWLQNWAGPSLPGLSFVMHCAGVVESLDGSMVETNRMPQNGYDSSSNSNNSSISSISCSCSDSDYRKTTGDGDLEADADSLSCRQSGLSPNDQMENCTKSGLKRPRTGMEGPFNQVETGITGIDQIGSSWDWDDDDRGVGMDIQALLSEFGDFGDFFENDSLPFGEPPGTAESEALMITDCGDIGSSPMVVMDASDQILMPTVFENISNLPSSTGTEVSLSKYSDVPNTNMSSIPTTTNPVPPTSEFDHLIKAEALMTFAPEYGAVETPSSEISSSVFRNPYLPKSRKAESPKSTLSNYMYGAAPPSSPCFDGTDGKIGVPATSKPHPGRNAHADDGFRQYYTYVESGKEQHDKRSQACSTSVITCEVVATSPPSNFFSINSAKSGHKKNEETFGTGHFPLFMKSLLATDVESIMFQASMCSMRHMLLSSSSSMPSGLCRLSGSSSFPGDSSTMTDNISGKYEVKKKESIPIRIAGDSDGGNFEGHLNPPMRVWRSVGVPKVSKSMNSPSIDVSASLTHSSFNEESILSYGQRQPLQELLDGMPLLIQQAASFIDVALDADCGDGPYGWLALQEQWRRGFPCGPSMIHAGCGGTLASCHSLDIAGVELVDPLSADVHASSVISLLQCDIKAALKSAFDALDGPLLVADWCKGRNKSGEAGRVGDCFSAESTMTECRDSSSAISIGEPMSPNISSTGGTSCLRSDIGKGDDTCQKKLNSDICGSEQRAAVSVLPPPAILVGYQDDWLKTSASALQFWEKAPLEPYALQKPITYTVVCPNIDPLTSAATDFFQQLGTVYETCKLGTHSPQSVGNQMEIDSGKGTAPGFVLLDCPQSMKIESSNASLVGSISDYFLSLSNGWDLASYLKSLSRTLKSLNLGSFVSSNQKEGNGSSCAVVYVVCPFPEPIAILQTLIESCVSIESVNLQSDRERRSLLYNQVGKALNCSAAVDEASVSNVLVLSGFSIPKLVLQIVTVDVIFRVTNPALNELIVLKETAFTVYNKARRISRGSCSDAAHSSTLSGRSPLMMNQMASSLHGTWRDCVGPRMMGPSISRETEIEATLRSASWENTWQTARTGGLSCDPNRTTELILQDEIRYMFEPLFILAEPGSIEHGISPAIFGCTASESSRVASDDNSAGYIQSANSMASVDAGLGSQLDASETDSSGSSQSMTPSLHCCYGWTEDWRWLVCIWTDSRGELLDSHIFPFGGTSSRQDTKGLQCLFAQVLQQGCQILQSCSSSEPGVIKPRDFVITRIGSFYELEYLEWQKALSSVGGSDMKKWPLQLRRSASDGMAASGTGSSLQQQDINLIQERTLPSSPGPLYSPHSKNSGFMKGALGQTSARKQLMGGNSTVDSSRGLLQWVQSISFVTVSVDHTLQLVFQADSSSLGGSQGGLPTYLEGFTPVKSLGSTPASYVFIPSPKMRFLPPTPLQLPTFLTAESPPLAHLLHSKGSAVPLSTCFVVSKAVPSMRKDRSNMKEEWPSVISVSLVDYYGGNMSQDKIARGIIKQGGKGLGSEAKDIEIGTHLVLESVAAELHALSWMTVSPAYLERRTALPFHCDMVLRLRRVLHFADKELCRHREK